MRIVMQAKAASRATMIVGSAPSMQGLGTHLASSMLAAMRRIMFLV